MKKLHCLILITVIFVVFLANTIETNAMNTGFSTEELSEDVQNAFKSNIQVSLLTQEPDKKAISCFDVNSAQLIAIGQFTLDARKTVCVYSMDGIFQYGYTFNSNGDFGVEWDEENLNIYFVRSDIIISLDSKGNILEIKRVFDTVENNSYKNHFIHGTQRTIGDVSYWMTSDMGIFNWVAFSYSRIIVIDDSGCDFIVYDVNSTQLLRTVAHFFLIIAVVALAIVAIIRYTIKNYKTYKGEN